MQALVASSAKSSFDASGNPKTHSPFISAGFRCYQLTIKIIPIRRRHHAIPFVLPPYSWVRLGFKFHARYGYAVLTARHSYFSNLLTQIRLFSIGATLSHWADYDIVGTPIAQTKVLSVQFLFSTNAPEFQRDSVGFGPSFLLLLDQDLGPVGEDVRMPQWHPLLDHARSLTPSSSSCSYPLVAYHSAFQYQIGRV